jgi:hypothetical protein
MNADLRPGSGDGPEEALRAILREWRVPSPPPGMEEDLRRAFRRRRGPRRRVRWLALAAAAAFLAAWPLLRRDVAPSVPVGSPAASLKPPVPPIAPAATEPAAPAPVEPARARRRVTTAPPPALEKVIVEPGQAELLVRFHQSLQDLRPPTTVLSGDEVEVVPAHAAETPDFTAAVSEVPSYRAAWEKVGDEWPLVQLSAPNTGR